MKLKESVQQWLKRSATDPIAKIILENSHLTKTQLETLLIDVLADSISVKTVNYDHKAQLRLTKARISRGSFNRTLRQAKDNVVKSIYTVILMGYLGIFESTTLDPYLELANRLHTYLEALKKVPNKSEEAADQIRIIELLREELQASLKQPLNPSQSVP